MLDALEHLDGWPTPFTVVPTFLTEVDRALQTRQPSAGLGEDVRPSGEDVIGSSLELEGELSSSPPSRTGTAVAVLSAGSPAPACGNEVAVNAMSN